MQSCWFDILYRFYIIVIAMWLWKCGSAVLCGTFALLLRYFCGTSVVLLLCSTCGICGTCGNCGYYGTCSAVPYSPLKASGGFLNFTNFRESRGSFRKRRIRKEKKLFLKGRYLKLHPFLFFYIMSDVQNSLRADTSSTAMGARTTSFKKISRAP